MRDVLASDSEIETSTTSPPTTQTLPMEPSTSAPPTMDPTEGLGRVRLGNKGETTTLPAGADSQAAQGSAIFTGASGRVEIEIPTHWEYERFESAQDVDVWYFEDAVSMFRPNLSLTTQYTGDLSMLEFLDYNAKFGLPGSTDFVVIDSYIVVGPDGQDVGVFEFTAVGYHFLMVAQIEDGLAHLITLVSTDSRFAELRSEAEPAMLSLRIID